MAHDKLKQALSSVDWNSNVTQFIEERPLSKIVVNCNLRLAIWAKQFENADRGNPALAFIREMQAAGHYVAALTALALYKPAAASMRTVFETALYYTYFRSHPSELSTLVRDPKYFLYKSTLIEYHKAHTLDFTELQNRFRLIVTLDEWYNRISAIIHGQLPGGWVEHKSLSEMKHHEGTLSIAVATFRECEEIVHHLFLCTAGRELWDGFSSTSKTKLIKGITGDVKASLGLDAA